MRQHPPGRYSAFASPWCHVTIRFISLPPGASRTGAFLLCHYRDEALHQPQIFFEKGFQTFDDAFLFFAALFVKRIGGRHDGLDIRPYGL